jgi:hypothetical protein
MSLKLRGKSVIHKSLNQIDATVPAGLFLLTPQFHKENKFVRG